MRKCFTTSGAPLVPVSSAITGSEKTVVGVSNGVLQARTTAEVIAYIDFTREKLPEQHNNHRRLEGDERTEVIVDEMPDVPKKFVKGVAKSDRWQERGEKVSEAQMKLKSARGKFKALNRFIHEDKVLEDKELDEPVRRGDEAGRFNLAKRSYCCTRCCSTKATEDCW